MVQEQAKRRRGKPRKPSAGKLEAWIEASGKTLTEIANLSGVSSRTIWRWRHQKTPSPHRLQVAAVAAVLKVDTDLMMKELTK